MDTRHLFAGGVEYRANEGRLITGPVITYGQHALTPRGRERVERGAMLGLGDPNLPVNLQHRQQPTERIGTVGDGILTFEDGPTALRANLVAPDGDVGTRAIEGVQNGTYTGWSSEFVGIIEAVESGVTVVYRALAVGLGLVDKPAYGGSLVQLRQGHNLLISGPAGAGKSQLARELAADDLAEVVEYQEIYAELVGAVRDPETGRYPPRDPGDSWALGRAEDERMARIDAGVASGRPIIATNSNGSPTRRDELLGRLGDGAVEEVLDPGEEVVTRRLSGAGGLSRQCRNAVDRWYRWERVTPRPWYRSERRLAWL